MLAEAEAELAEAKVELTHQEWSAKVTNEKAVLMENKGEKEIKRFKKREHFYLERVKDLQARVDGISLLSAVNSSSHLTAAQLIFLHRPQTN